MRCGVWANLSRLIALLALVLPLLGETFCALLRPRSQRFRQALAITLKSALMNMEILHTISASMYAAVWARDHQFRQTLKVIGEILDS
ncbi:hypothetical protein BV20DRAFT_410861 [Pilatotrama ljubarskyi]|nr:hypothetical protein BV20DRAFT_410861 [Pilatotrama ljubarskyi]